MIVSRRVVLPAAVALMLMAMPVVYGVVPWALSRLAARHGWIDGRPGIWNWIGLLFVAVGGALLGLVIFWMLRRVPDLPDRVKIETTSQLLITDGPFGASRNPMYIAAFTIWIGWIIFYGSIAVACGLLVLGLFGLLVVVPYEERRLEARFGDSYRDYKNRVPRWLM